MMISWYTCVHMYVYLIYICVCVYMFQVLAPPVWGVGWGGRWLCMQCVHGIPPPPVVWVGVGRGLHMLYGE